MEILFTKGKNPFSELICSVTKEPVSHVVIKIGIFVLHSNLRGVNMELFESFKKKSDIKFSLVNPKLTQKEMKELDERAMETLAKYEHSFYDIGALLFDGISFLLRSWFKVKMPKRNLWNSTGMFICTEFVTQALDGKADSLITPYGLYLKLKMAGWTEAKLSDSSKTNSL